MKKVLSFLTLAVMLGVRVMAQTSGGPDTYGYVWRNSNDPNGPAYNWVEIAGLPNTVTVTGLADDNVVGPFAIGFNFPYYWLDATQVWIGSNGYIGFSSIANIASTSIGFPGIPTAFPINQNHFLAPMMCDLNFADSVGQVAPGNPGRVYLYTSAAQDSFVITYESVPFYSNSAYAGTNTFQVILSKADSSITFQYKAQNGVWDDGYDGVTNPLVVGIENVTGQIGLQVSNNTYPTPNTAVKFYYPATVTYQVTDVQADANFNSENGGIFAALNSPMTPMTIVKNVGNQAISGTVQCTTSVFPAGSLTPVTGSTLNTTYTAGLAVGQEVQVSQSSTYTPTATGSFFLRGQLSLTGDATTGNNRAETEMNVVDLAQASVKLSYDRFVDTFDQTLHSISGFGSGNGIGIYFEPPLYGSQIDSVEMFVITTSVPSDFTINMYKNDGAPGAGTNLGTVTIAAANLPANAVVRVPVPVTPAIQLNAGEGVYVSFVQGGDSTYLVTDLQPPFSYRSYEVLFGNWASHRSRSTEDPVIRLITSSYRVSNDAQVNGNVSGLGQNYPNPAANTTRIEFELATGGNAEFSVSNIHGQVVETRSLESLNSGTHSLDLDLTNYASGIYFYTLKSGNGKMTRKMTVAH
ncbi:MAG: T9SS type A sorting domain-containing protein [Bacteroidia bacterium]|nr:T9SS type A sorting domain-containing protein [Bacteroidia bacterium]